MAHPNERGWLLVQTPAGSLNLVPVLTGRIHCYRTGMPVPHEFHEYAPEGSIIAVFEEDSVSADFIEHVYAQEVVSGGPGRGGLDSRSLFAFMQALAEAVLGPVRDNG